MKRALAVSVTQNTTFEMSQFWLLHRIELFVFIIKEQKFADVYYMEMLSQELCEHLNKHPH